MLPSEVIVEAVNTLEPLIFINALPASISSGRPLYMGAKLIVSHLFVPVLFGFFNLCHAVFTVSFVISKSKSVSNLKRSMVNVSPSVSVLNE